MDTLDLREAYGVRGIYGDQLGEDAAISLERDSRD
jgi:hypothetical protein